MTAGEAARLLGARLEGDPRALLTGAAEDSRLLHPGDLFVALRGERTDGHRFVGEALAVAAAALVREEEPLPPPPPGRALLRVADPLAAAEALAAHERRRRPWRVAGVTGSVGKTTTKELLRTSWAPPSPPAPPAATATPWSACPRRSSPSPRRWRSWWPRWA